MLRPIHVIQSGLSRLGRGELDVKLDLEEQEFRDLGSSFDAISAQLSALGRGAKTDQATADLRPGSATDLESVMDNLEDAVALFSPRGELIFSNKSMNALQPRALETLPAESPVRQIVERTLAGRKSQGPVSIAGLDPADTAERLLMTHVIEDTSGRFLGAMLVAQEHWVLKSGAVHAQLLSQTRRARAADGGRGARGEESAERDDDSSRAAETEARAATGDCRRRPGLRAPTAWSLLLTSRNTSTSSARRFDDSTKC